MAGAERDDGVCVLILYSVASLHAAYVFIP